LNIRQDFFRPAPIIECFRCGPKHPHRAPVVKNDNRKCIKTYAKNLAGGSIEADNADNPRDESRFVSRLQLTKWLVTRTPVLMFSYIHMKNAKE
jgi:hypothetical protein